MNFLKKDILTFYKQTSCYTDLGLYEEFAKNLPDDLETLCLLLRHQTIHPFDLKDEEQRKETDNFYGDMTSIPKTSLNFENDLFPTAGSMLAELLRRDKTFSIHRNIQDKIHVCCREEAILLASILKAKGIPARVRSGFTSYVSEIDSAGDHWITEYYNEKENRWVLVDANMYYDDAILEEYEIDFNLLDIPREKFIFGAEAYLKLRKGVLKEKDIYYASNPYIYGIPAAIRGLFFDFHSLMNNEIIFLHQPKYAKEKNFLLSEEEYLELDKLATLMLEPNVNFLKLKEIWETNEKFRILSGGMN